MIYGDPRGGVTGHGAGVGITGLRHDTAALPGESHLTAPSIAAPGAAADTTEDEVTKEQYDALNAKLDILIELAKPGAELSALYLANYKAEIARREAEANAAHPGDGAPV